MPKKAIYLVIASLFLFAGCASKPQSPGYEVFVDSLPFTGVDTEQKVKVPVAGNNQNKSLQDWEQFLAGNWELLRPGMVSGYKEGLKAGANMKLEKILHDTENWHELAWLVKECNYGDNLQYYYLGRAAEGMHSYDAAETYYNMSNVASKSLLSRCFGPGCSEYNFPEDVNARLELISELKESEKNQNGITKENITQTLPRNEQDPEQIIKEIITSANSSSGVKERLEQLNDLKENNLITEEDYNMKKAEILKDL